MSIDMRAFVYALEPLLRRRQWQLDAMQARLGKLQQDINTKQSAANDLRAQHLADSQLAAPSLAVAFDCSAHARRLQWLVRLQSRMAELDAELASLLRDRSALIGQCRSQQHKVEAIEAHRKDSAAEFSTQESTRQAREADRDWLARAAAAQMRHSSSAEAGA